MNINFFVIFIYLSTFLNLSLLYLYLPSILHIKIIIF